MKKIIKILSIFYCFLFLFITKVYALKQEELKVLIIEINPTIERITSSEFAGGHPKVSQYFSQDMEAGINELIEDLEFTSHNYLDVNIVKREYLNEYPTYRTTVRLNNGSMSNRLDEDTYLSLSGYDGSTHGNWYTLLGSGIFNRIQAYSFDYTYIIDKFNLIERRNNKEFDQVWLITIDPAQTYETIMIGNNPFWVNAPGYIADCQNFMMANFSISRRDANLHALAHGVEGIMNAAFNRGFGRYVAYNGGSYKHYYTSYSSYDANVITIDPTSYKNLNYWEMFNLGTYSNTLNYSSVGNVHFPFNGTSDYNYSNTTMVQTNWREWLNYPNIEGKFETDNNQAWLTNAGNNLLGPGENKDPDRLFIRWWFYLMPHIDGYTKDGHLNNWWQYFKTLDFVTEINPISNLQITTKVGEKIPLSYELTYNSGVKETKNIEPQYDNVSIDGESIQVINTQLMAVKEGESNITIYHDNKSITYSIEVLKEEEKEPEEIPDPPKEEEEDKPTDNKPNDNQNNTVDENETYDEAIGEENPNTGYFIPITIIITSFIAVFVIRKYVKKDIIHKI